MFCYHGNAKWEDCVWAPSVQFDWVELNLDLFVELILFNAEILQTTYWN